MKFVSFLITLTFAQLGIFVRSQDMSPVTASPVTGPPITGAPETESPTGTIVPPVTGSGGDGNFLIFLAIVVVILFIVIILVRFLFCQPVGSPTQQNATQSSLSKEEGANLDEEASTSSRKYDVVPLPKGSVDNMLSRSRKASGYTSLTFKNATQSPLSKEERVDADKEASTLLRKDGGIPLPEVTVDNMLARSRTASGFTSV